MSFLLALGPLLIRSLAGIAASYHGRTVDYKVSTAPPRMFRSKDVKLILVDVCPGD